MLCAAGMSVEVAFETPEQISEKLARYERLFQDRYTDRDEGYLLCLQRASKVLNVPVMSPWPPRGSYHHRGGGGGGGRYSYDDWDGRGRGRRRGFRGGRHRDYCYPPYHHPRYYNDTYHHTHPGTMNRVLPASTEDGAPNYGSTNKMSKI